MGNSFSPVYRPMAHRAGLFERSASWPLVMVSLLALWFGFRIIFSTIFSMWMFTPGVAADPSKVDAFIAASTPGATGWTLATFLIYLVIILAMARLFHGLSLRHLIGPLRPAWWQFWRVSLYLAPLYAFLTLPLLLEPEPFQQLSLSKWLLILPAILPLLFVQISAEELVFRGYLQGQIAALSAHPLVWMGLPSVLFGMAHYDPYAPAYSAWAYVVWATCFGWICADLTARSGTLGPALALHFINNISAILVLASDDWLFGAALYVWPLNGAYWEPWIPYEALSLVVVWLTGRLALRR